MELKQRRPVIVSNETAETQSLTSDKNVKSIRLKPAFRYQKVLTRTVLSLAVFSIVYFTSKKDKNVTFGGIKENIVLREQKLDCSILAGEFGKSSTCGRFTSDEIFTTEEINEVLDKLGSIISTESTVTKSLSSLGEIFNSTVQMILPKATTTLEDRFNLHQKQFVLSYDDSMVAVISNESNEFSERLQNLHADTEVDARIGFTFFVMFSTMNKNLTDGRLIFVDVESSKKTKNSIVESKKGRVIGFSSGFENMYYLQRVKKGSLIFLKLLFIRDEHSRHE